MQVLLWAVEGVAIGCITGKMMAGIRRDLVLDSVMGMAGGIGGAFIVNSFGFFGQAKMISTDLATIVGAIVITAATRFISGSRDSLIRRLDEAAIACVSVRGVPEILPEWHPVEEGDRREWGSYGF